MTSKCGSCYFNITVPSCPWDKMVRDGDGCKGYMPAKLYERGRPRGAEEELRI